ncbi:hypothetical protein HU675_0038655 [Bradyrhizobium septentrionale]|uniref:hypothetical protein n=1 Tax=Bradyrhizobium septentrionale TaxID=1404411 RepID=UPI00159665F0|nr:hypothetical protein [Bradyrhizobium septentrionale]UGY23808.1 hypothetical protein HU675_0038655 [Bradyrhizobium septentrionale]
MRWLIDKILGGIIGKIAGVILSAVFLMWGIAPETWFAEILQNPPHWVLNPWTRLGVVIVGVIVALAVMIVRFRSRPDLSKGEKPSGHTLTQYSPPVPSGLYTRQWVLVYNPSNPKGRKNISFNEDGTIGEGRNHNEWRWSYTNDHLDVWMKDNRLHNRFKYDPPSGRFHSTNDLEMHGMVKNQVIYQGKV